MTSTSHELFVVCTEQSKNALAEYKCTLLQRTDLSQSIFIALKGPQISEWVGTRVKEQPFPSHTVEKATSDEEPACGTEQTVYLASMRGNLFEVDF